MRILGLIPARAGSKGIPGKNIRMLAGKPLIVHTIETALESESLTDVIVSTDSEEIAEIARAADVEIPFIRPRELAQDDTPTFPVVKHAIETLAGLGREYDAVCLLQPTNPLRSPLDITACVDLLETTGADSVISMVEVPHQFNPHWAYTVDENGIASLFSGADQPIPRRQELPPAFHRDGTIYLTRTEVILKSDSLYGERIVPFIMDSTRSVNLDTMNDWEEIEERLKNDDREDWTPRNLQENSDNKE
jgi:CMP-N,N'-diacetyllegionaminic acid synthase